MIPPDAVAVSALAAFALNALAAFTLALLVAVLLRRPLRRLAGPRIAYGLWLLPPVAVLATLWTSLRPAATALPYRGVHLDAGMLVLAHATPARAADAMLPAALLLVWSAGSVCALLWLAWRYRTLRRGLRALPVAALQSLRRQHALPRAQRLALHPAGPALLWAPRPLLLLPPDFAQRYGTAQQAHILRHELCHRAQGDAWWNLLAALLGALFWMHPLLPWARRCFLLDQELACDALLLQRHRAAPRAYADTLLLAATGTVLPLASGVAQPRQLKERIAMLAQTRCSLPRRIVGTASILLLVSATVLAAPAPSSALSGLGGMHTDARTHVTYQVSIRIPDPGMTPMALLTGTHPDPMLTLKAPVTDTHNGNRYLRTYFSSDGWPIATEEISKPGREPVFASASAVIQQSSKPGTYKGKHYSGWIEVPLHFKLSPN